jgi:hypothetical protein
VSRRRRREDGGRAGRDEGVLRHLQRADHHGRRVVISLKVKINFFGKALNYIFNTEISCCRSFEFKL